MAPLPAHLERWRLIAKSGRRHYVMLEFVNQRDMRWSYPLTSLRGTFAWYRRVRGSRWERMSIWFTNN